MTNIRGAGLVLQGGEGHEGFFIDHKGTAGLFGGLSVRSSSVEIPQDVGEFDVPVFKTARSVAIQGTCEASSPERLDHFALQLSGALADGSLGSWVFDFPGGPRWANGRVVGQEFEPEVWGELATFLLQLKFAKPQLFGNMNTAAAAQSVTIFHYGNFKASPVLVITPTSSMTSGYTLNLPGGKKVIVTQPLTTGHVHEYNTATGRLKLDGVLQVGATSRRDTIAVKGGAQVTISITATVGAGLITPFTPDTFI
ncbi:hypothetical protein EV379_1252 [Microterricola gilva]|uniref:Uncharacterized protein n=1 Tax=Microterricola gilva TaxID=393267 RepID=A0A4Q8ALK7_9MICO|nr:hypothetical protein [Microterricola gilva]RZU64941.1 hypothetical protein EV379_1252 [Microterricola gilva]